MGKGSSSIVVYAGSSTEAALVRSLLESNGNAYRLVDEHIGTMTPHLSAGGGAGAVKVGVAQSDAERARGLLADHGR
jgi:hypothetical protein